MFQIDLLECYHIFASQMAADLITSAVETAINAARRPASGRPPGNDVPFGLDPVQCLTPPGHEW
jgi:hypothetical protein